MSGRKVKFRVDGDTLDDAFKEFMISKKADGLSPHTLKSYEYTFYALRHWFDLDTPLDLITDKTFKEVFAKMADSTMSRNTIRTYSATLMSLFSWCRANGKSDVKIPLFKGEEVVKEIYTPQELRVLLKHPSKRTATFAELRTWAIINLLVNNGVRAMTIRLIKNEDVHLENSTIALRHTKSRKPYAIPLSPEMVAVLKEWMRIRKGEPGDYLFCNIEGGQMSDECLHSSVRHYNTSRGIEKVGIHMFRHTFARMYLVDCHGDALKLQKLLGHSTLRMTQHYVQIYASDLVDDFKTDSPLSKIKNKKER